MTSLWEQALSCLARENGTEPGAIFLGLCCSVGLSRMLALLWICAVQYGSCWRYAPVEHLKCGQGSRGGELFVLLEFNEFKLKWPHVAPILESAAKKILW